MFWKFSKIMNEPDSLINTSECRNQFRSNHQRCSVRKGVLRNFTKFTSKNLCQSLFFNKVVGLRPATLFKKRLQHRCFPVNLVKFLRTSFLQNTSGSCFFQFFNCFSTRIKTTYKQNFLKKL